jgi:hypothetical protein
MSVEAHGAGLGDRSYISRLIRRRGVSEPGADAGPLGSLHAWVLSLPFVVERPRARNHYGVRLFGVDCKPLRRRRTWLMTGPVREQDGVPQVPVSVVFPEEFGPVAESANWGVTTGELPAGHGGTPSGPCSLDH